MTVYIPSRGAKDWRPLLGDPKKHWRKGYSAHSIAHSWEAARGLPPEINTVFGGNADLLFAFPEHQVKMPGKGYASQCDVFALVRYDGQTIAMAVEGKVEEAIGPTVGDWLKGDKTGNRRARLDGIAQLLGLAGKDLASLRYQLLHRSAAAVVESQRIGLSRAALIVQSFSPKDTGLDDYKAFTTALGVPTVLGKRVTADLPGGIKLDLAWVRGKVPKTK